MSQQRRVAIVTGASRGIGRGIAVALGCGGWRIAVNYASSADGAEQTRQAVIDAGGEAIVVQADVSRDADRRVLVDRTVDQFGAIDLLVNNAGITSPGRADLLEATEEGFDHLMGINLKGPYFLTQLAVRQMIDQPPPSADQPPRSIVNISSLSAYAVSTNRGDYCLAKAAMEMMGKLWAVRLAEYNICVYTIQPGVIESDMTAPVRERYDRLIREENLLPIARWGTPDDVGRAVASLADGALPYCTGDVINIDGGFHIRRI